LQLSNTFSTLFDSLNDDDDDASDDDGG